MWQLLRKLARRFPRTIQFELRRFLYRIQIVNNSFITTEPEYRLLEVMIKPGDWVVDVGANIGHHTKRFSTLVGKDGRVIAIEPVPITFALLASNMTLFENQNVTLLNVALSNKTDCASINIPYDKYNDLIYTRAELSDTRSNNSYAVLTFQYDDNLNFHHKIALVKIDVEGHEESVLLGMENLLMRDHPILIIETRSQSVKGKLTMLGYSSQILPNSPNIIFTV